MKEELIKWLEKEKWYPLIHVTEVELETSELLNKILDNMITRLK